MDLSLPRLADGSVSLAFSNAFFEHLYRPSRGPHLQRIREALAPDGACCYMGIPYFRNIARLYVERGPGTAGPVFDLYNVYRYTHGDPEGQHAWWIGQLHKSLFDEDEVAALLAPSGFGAFVMFCYGYPGDVNEVPVTMGFYATREAMRAGGAAAPVPGVSRPVRGHADPPRARSNGSPAARADHAALQADHRVRRHALQRLADPEERPDRRRARSIARCATVTGAQGLRAVRLGPHRRRRARARAGRAPRRQHEPAARHAAPPAQRRAAGRHQHPRRGAGAAPLPRAPRRGGAPLPLSDRAAPHGVREAVRLVGEGAARRRTACARPRARSSACTTSGRSPRPTRERAGRGRRRRRWCSSIGSTSSRTATSCSSASRDRTSSGRWCGGSSACSSRSAAAASTPDAAARLPGRGVDGAGAADGAAVGTVSRARVLRGRPARRAAARRHAARALERRLDAAHGVYVCSGVQSAPNRTPSTSRTTSA